MSIEEHLEDEKEDFELDRINMIRTDYDLPPISREELFEREAKYMWETYGYDVES